MIREFYRVTIMEFGRSRPQDVDGMTCFNQFTETFPTIEEVKVFLQHRYGKPLDLSKYSQIYIDIEDKPVPMGITYSYWNKDWSHASFPWYQTDMIIIERVKEKVDYILNWEED